MLPMTAIVHRLSQIAVIRSSYLRPQSGHGISSIWKICTPLISEKWHDWYWYRSSGPLLATIESIECGWGDPRWLIYECYPANAIYNNQCHIWWERKDGDVAVCNARAYAVFALTKERDAVHNTVRDERRACNTAWLVVIEIKDYAPPKAQLASAKYSYIY
jgi:hypothetical protein